MVRMLQSFTEAELAERRTFIGGSEAGLIYKGEYFGKTVVDLWREKTGRAEHEVLDDKLNVQMGTWTEELNRQWYERKTKLTVDTSKELCYMQRHPEFEFVGGNLDGVVIDSTGEKGVWEAKHTSPFNKNDLSEFYYPQLQHLMLVTGYQYSVLSWFIGNDRWKQAEVQRDEAFIEELLAREKEFWHCVELDIEPAI